MSKFVVQSLGLNLRRSPEVRPGNVIVILNQGQEVEVVDTGNDQWWEVRATVQGSTVRGFVAPRFLKGAGLAAPTPVVTSIQAVHFPFQAAATTTSVAARHSPLADSTVARRDVNGSAQAKKDALHRIIDTLDVERSARYQPRPTATFCNIYAYDYCYFANVYLPRVWWHSKPLLALARGEAQPVRYAETVYEINANGLYDWLRQWGGDFGWQRVFDLDALQESANGGGVGIVCAQRKNLQRSGHITCVVPETDVHNARRANQRVIAPLQSQAGTSNKAYFAQAWWVLRATDYRALGFWVHA